MNNKRNCIASDIFANFRCIKNIFTNNSGTGITHLLMLMLPGFGCISTADAAVLRVDGSGSCINRQMAVWV